MITYDKKFLQWFVRFGKIKSGILYFLFLLLCFLIIVAACDLINWLTTKETFIQAFKPNFDFIYCIVFLYYTTSASYNFYDQAQKKLKEYAILEAKGLTPGDIKRISFIKNWEIKRKIGINRFCYYDGGLFTGLILFIPISLISYPFASGSFSEFHDMMFFILKCLIISYTLGAIIYRLRWEVNQRKFIRLTDPLLLNNS